jgi:hypothetical protein
MGRQPRPFGLLSYRTLLEREKHLTQAEEARQQAAYEFDVFCREQRERHAASLKASAKRIQVARWGTDLDGDGLFVVTREGSTEVSKPIRRPYQEQL